MKPIKKEKQGKIIELWLNFTYFLSNPSALKETPKFFSTAWMFQLT